MNVPARTPYGRGPLSLVVLGDRQLASYPLPSSGAITIGRAASCDISIVEKSISRRHATLRLGDTLTIEDLASASGTRLAGAAIRAHTQVRVKQGEVIELGDVSILIQRRPTATAPRRLWSHGYFEGRLADECARATEGTLFSLVFLHCNAAPPRETIQAALADLVRAVDVAGEYGGGDYEVLLVDTAPPGAELRADALVERLRRNGVLARAGLASFPRDGRTADQLLARACAAARPGAPITPSDVVVEDPAMLQLRRVIDRVAAGTLSVLLIGETGVGKHVLAERVHHGSPRKGRPFLRLDCAAATETLLESELFGHERGAFTGAVAARPGLLETANGGTVFLDEIGAISPALQVKLLRVLEERLVVRVGGLGGSPIDVRFVAATNRDLEAEVARGRFRQDLYYRLAGITLVVPPLRERVAEIAPLVMSFITSGAAQRERRPQVSGEALAMLEAYAWPGNLRELRNVIERAVLLCTDGVIRAEHLPLEKMRATYPAPDVIDTGRSQPPERDEPPVREHPAPRGTHEPQLPEVEVVPTSGLAALYPGDAERDRIIAALESCRGNQTRAAALLGMSRRTLIHRLERYGLPRPRKPRTGN